MPCDTVLNTRKQQMLAEVSGGTREVVLRGVVSRKSYVSRPGSAIVREGVPTEKAGTYALFSLGLGQRGSIGRVTTPCELPALNGVKRCDSAQGIVDLTTPPSLVCVRARVSPGSIEQ